MGKNDIEYKFGSGIPPMLSIVIACYKEMGHLQKNTREIVRYLNQTKFSFELIFVEDASPDDTFLELKETSAWLEKQNIPHAILRHETNQGRGKTVQDGMFMARGDIVGFIDIDLENLLDGLLPIIIKLQEDQADVIIARRVVYTSTPLRMMLSFGYRFILKTLLRLPLSDTEAGFKFFLRQKILPILPLIEDKGWFWDTEIVYRCLKMGLRVQDHPIVFLRNPKKESTVRVIHDSFAYLRSLFALLKKTP